MTPPLCLNPRCRIPGRHGDGCDGECRGCLKGWAADGLRLCLTCTRRLSESLLGWTDKDGREYPGLVELHGELELVLKAAGSGERASSKPGSGTPPRDAVVDMRAEIRHVLVSWCRLISEERGMWLPGHWVVQRLARGFIGPPNRTWIDDDTLPAIGAYVARHAEWLAATEYAGEAADELAGLMSRAWGLAYPSGTRRLSVGPCPLCGGVPGRNAWVVEQLPRGFIGPPRRAGKLEALVREREKCIKHERLDCPDRLCRAQDLLPSEVFCDMVDEHRWPATAWGRLDKLVIARRRAA
jgi:hypothetical protein